MKVDTAIDPVIARRAVLEYNHGTYRGRRNVDIDRAAYALFKGGLSPDREQLVRQITFVGDEYGGAQARFIPHSVRAEATRIANRLGPLREQYSDIVSSQRPLVERVPDETALTYLLEPFVATKRWSVWASKTLHFLRPETFPVLDSRAKKALGLAAIGGSGHDYWRFATSFREVLLASNDALAVARTVDGNSSPTVLKLMDKILYEIGR